MTAHFLHNLIALLTPGLSQGFRFPVSGPERLRTWPGSKRPTTLGVEVAGPRPCFRYLPRSPVHYETMDASALESGWRETKQYAPQKLQWQ
ncbi:jg9812 [Pararge aegeria aegeria]|uniref:Jg9812 protein n=1 Tax=Pararge aegeria aegeria TaxID=348720 RepID=A0A8S4RLK4_9NEOP|nr:jg9812 [Pararge aegeria aegeria]